MLNSPDGLGAIGGVLSGWDWDCGMGLGNISLILYPHTQLHTFTHTASLYNPANAASSGPNSNNNNNKGDFERFARFELNDPSFIFFIIVVLRVPCFDLIMAWWMGDAFVLLLF